MKPQFNIPEDELIQLALDLCNIDSPPGKEGPVGEFVLGWLTRNGIRARKIGMFPDRFNVLGTIPGTGDGYSLIFNSHMDTGKFPDDHLGLRNPGQPVNHSAWRDGDHLAGEGIVNDKGPLAACLMAARAVQQSGIQLKGDLLVSAVAGEIGQEPVDEFEAPKYLSKEIGTRYLIQHGGVADYALVAEGTDFGLVGVEAGKAFFKLTVFGNDLPIYTPYIQRPTPIAKNPNAIVRMAPLLQRIDEWAYEYEQKNRYECRGGVIVPRVNVGAIRGGVPYKITKTVQQCAIYLDVRITPVQNPLDIREDLRKLVASAGLEGEVELYTYRPAFEADPQKVEPLAGAITRAHQAIVGTTPKPASPPFSSMWRDINCFNEMRIPAITYGPGVSVGGGNFSMKISDLVTGSRLYALTALDLCDQERA